ncbi:DUF2510 domain-containing protein [Mycobacterium sp. 1164985.4]|uniref:DUF2510 domain-containing protein n=1 Tax=Mycobacterium sp. 1164985.4 TaxID=1834069 RepID=UPI000A98E005
MTNPYQAGWYDDPYDANAQRFWDGRNWTPHQQLKTTPSMGQPARPWPAPMPTPGPPAQPLQMPPGSPAPATPGPWERIRPHVNQARDDGRQFWSHQSRQRKIIWASAGAAAAVAAAIVFVVALGSLGIFGFGTSAGKSTEAFCAELNSLWDGGVRQAHTDVVAEVFSAHQAGSEPSINTKGLAQTAKNAQQLADDAPPAVKPDLTLIAEELSAVAAGNIASVTPGGDETVIVGWQAYHCNALTGDS